MTKSIAVTPYFERAEGKDDDIVETYEAGLRGSLGENAVVQIELPARLVERTVLVGARLSSQWKPATPSSASPPGLTRPPRRSRRPVRRPAPA